MLLNTCLHLHVPFSPTARHLKPLSSSVQTHAPLPRGSLARSAHPPLRHVASPTALETAGDGEGDEEDLGPASAAAVAAAISRASSSSPVRFRRVSRGEAQESHGEGDVAEPSADFRRLCAEQLEMFRVVVSRDAILSVYVRPAGSYIMDQLELRRVALFPGISVPERDVVVLVGKFSISAGLRAAEVTLVKQQMEVIAEFGAVVLPMVKHPFVVGFLVAELPELQDGRAMSSHVQLPSAHSLTSQLTLHHILNLKPGIFRLLAMR